jgi:uncharacterized membrane protein
MIRTKYNLDVAMIASWINISLFSFFQKDIMVVMVVLIFGFPQIKSIQ